VAGVTNLDAERLHDAEAALWLDLAATAASVGEARRAVAAYCVEHGAESGLTDRVLLSVSEAVTNVLVHAYRHVDEPSRERIELEARRSVAALVVIVRDFGCGMRPRLDSPGLNRNGRPIRALAIDSQFLCSTSVAVFNVKPRTHHKQKVANVLFTDGSVTAQSNRDRHLTLDLQNNADLYDAFNRILGILERADEAY
jgi:prepilin-type processing-associated H-X9-DG protein